VSRWLAAKTSRIITKKVISVKSGIECKKGDTTVGIFLIRNPAIPEPVCAVAWT
jgi:hypothetical protein